MNPQNAATPVLQAQGVTKRFGALVAVDHVNFQMAEHEVVAILGRENHVLQFAHGHVPA
jgi:ABC-type branched-subunit amino acid transport system ATPase component